MDTPFRESLREAAATVWEAVFAHPFLKELERGP